MIFATFFLGAFQQTMQTVREREAPVIDQTKSKPTKTLFTSKTCKFSNLFINTLSKHFLINDFNIIDVTDTIYDVSRVKVVPTIIVDNNRALAGRDAFAWLQNEIKQLVSGVETFGISSAFCYINDPDTAETRISSSYANIDTQEQLSVTPEPPKNSQKQLDLSSRLEELVQAREKL